MTQIASLVLFTSRPQPVVAFYRTVGLDLDHEDHGDAPAHFAADVDGVHFAVFAVSGAGRAPAWRQPGSSFPGFFVPSLDETVTRLVEQEAPVLVRHEVRPWGCRAVLEDPDGRPVEINQRDHCHDNA